MKHIITMTFGIILSLLAIDSQATDLIQVYQQALISDPTFQGQGAQKLSTQQVIPLARSALLPTINGNWYSQYNRFHNNSDNNLPTSITTPGSGNIDLSTFSQNTFRYNTNGYNVIASQPLFDFAAWSGYKEAKSLSKSADATYNAAAQDLMSRTATAYFEVLDAQDSLRYIQAEKQATQENLDVVTQQFKVGLVPITGVYQAQADYDSISSQEIEAKNLIINKKEVLRAITGVFYPKLAGLRNNKVPLAIPQPANIDTWVNTAEQQNWSLQAARYTANADREAIRVEQSGHLPTLAAIAEFDRNKSGSSPSGQTNTRQTYGGIQLQLPIFQGGFVSASSKKARYDYEAAMANMQTAYRTAVTNTRQSYNDVSTFINKVKADEQAIKSNQSSLESTIEGYRVGTQTMLDVLQQQEKLFDAWRTFSTDQYTYIIATINLKEAAGTLSPDDLAHINTWLTEKYVPFTSFQAMSIQRNALGGGKGKAQKSNTKKKPTPPKSSPVKKQQSANSFTNKSTTNKQPTAQKP